MDSVVIARTRRRASRLLACGIAAAASLASLASVPARAADTVSTVASSSAACAPHAAEAAARSALPDHVILRVMHVESRGRPNAMSPKGAMGCMQIMPATWRYLTARHGLGGDPWNARFNMIGGALYLAELARQFGFPGAYAAYNAGPARYARHVRGAARLPAETVAYMASLSGTAPPRVRPDGRVDERTSVPPRWQEATLFLDGARPRTAPLDVGTQMPRNELFPLAPLSRADPDDANAGEK
jgi:soluble lytic murein transglycosylase-like protein